MGALERVSPRKNWLGAITLLALFGGGLGSAILFQNSEQPTRAGLLALLFAAFGVFGFVISHENRDRIHYENDWWHQSPGPVWEAIGAMLVWSLAGMFAVSWMNLTYDLHVSRKLGLALPLIGIGSYWAWHFGRRRALARAGPPQEDCR